MAKQPYITVTERLMLTADDKIVRAGEPGGVWLFAAPGHKIPIETAERYGLLKGKKPGKLKQLFMGPPQDKAFH